MTNWRLVLGRLIRADRKVLAIKLLAEVADLTLRDAAREIADICARRKPLPKGSAYPRLSPERLAYYTGQPWTFTLTEQLRRPHHRILAMIARTGSFTAEAVDGRDENGGTIRRGQGDLKAATELVRNGLAVEISRNQTATPQGGHTLHRAILVIGPK